MPSIKDSRPAPEDASAPVNQPLVIRFNQRMSVASLNAKTVTLLGPHGMVAVTPVGVEYGMLLFVTPKQDLLPNSRYTLFIKGASDQTGQALPFASIDFTTAQLRAGESEQTTTEGNGQSNVTPAVTANESGPVTGPNSRPLAMMELQAIAMAAQNKDPEIWGPDASHFKGDWRTRRAQSALQQLPPLQAPNGETALAGQVLTLHGRALANVTISVGNEAVQTDQTGRFLLTRLQPGKFVLSIDGATAQQGNRRYGFYQVQVNIEKHKTNVLTYTVWSSVLDTAGTINLPSPTLQETVLKSPNIPGLELRIPAGTVIRDHQGKVLTQLNMTAIPTDRPPFPIPGVGVPVYFTIQPGGATLTVRPGAPSRAPS